MEEMAYDFGPFWTEHKPLYQTFFDIMVHTSSRILEQKILPPHRMGDFKRGLAYIVGVEMIEREANGYTLNIFSQIMDQYQKGLFTSHIRIIRKFCINLR